MKKSLSLVLITLLFVVLGCSALTGKKDEVPPAAPSTDSNATGTAPAEDKPADDSKSSSGDSANLSYENFEKAELEMDYDKVKGIMGSDGNETSSTKTGNYESKTYQWKGEKYSTVTIRFQDGKMVSKMQSNLQDRKGTDDISLEKFNKVDTGASYSDVKGIIGSDGEMTSLSKGYKTTRASYRWKNSDNGYIYATFNDDKLENKRQSSLK